MMNKNLSPAQRALLEKWLQGQLNNISTNIPRRPPGSPVPLSFPQRRQLFLELLHPGTAVNNLSVLLQFKGNLSIPALEQSAAKIVSRHDSLRMHFCFRSGMPAPEVAADTCLKLPVVDLRNVDKVEQVAKARQFAEDDVLQPFDLTKAPLVRLKLYLLNDETCLLLVVAHHAVVDGWSLGVFLKELAGFYGEISSGQMWPKPELSIQYSDFAHWQTSELFESGLQAAILFWQKQLSGELPILELPADRPRGPRTTFSGGTRHFTISGRQTEALEKLSRETDCTLFMTLLTAFYILLHRYSGQDDIIIGTPVANRNRPGMENMIGVFINTLALRVKNAGDPTFRTLLMQVRRLCLEAYAHQDLPFEKLVEVLKPQRDLSRTPVFQVVFNLQNAPLPDLEIPGVETGFLDVDRGVSQFDLTLMVSKVDGQCHASVEYNNELFEAATVERMFQSYQVLLAEVIVSPERPISGLQLLSPKEQNHLVYGLNQTQFHFPREQCLHQLFEAQVEQTPDAVAVIHAGQTFTYVDLNRRANALARGLQSLGVRPGSRVGIWMEKSADLLVALLGVLKAGAAYVPIHTSFPAERVRFILSDAAVELLLTNEAPLPFGGPSVPVVQLSDKVFSKAETTNLHPNVTPCHLVYIIYTSGSTGQPKGVMVQHSALVNFLWSMRRRPGIKNEDVLLSVTAISFDIAALELFLPLLAGATVMIADKEMMTNPVFLCQAIKHHRVTMMQATPSIWQLLLDAGWTGEPHFKALCGGEALTRKLADQLLERVDQLWNMYGPTETTVWSSVNQIQKGDHPVTIGSPIGNTQLYILDRNVQPVPVGVIGELYIGGEGLAQGYVAYDDLTRERFIPDCFCTQPGARLYKTGDRARYLNDYSIEILGRDDEQVKIHGHRIELGEIAAVLMQHPAVQKAIATTRTETNNEKVIVAYYVRNNEMSSGAADFLDFLRKKLPAYMIPAAVVRLDCLPLSPNGKIDRKALPAAEAISSPNGYVGPLTKVEQILASIWQDVLDVEKVSVTDNFFDLGGASIQSLEIVAKATMSGIPLTVEMLFKEQTIAALSASLDGSL